MSASSSSETQCAWFRWLRRPCRVHSGLWVLLSRRDVFAFGDISLAIAVLATIQDVDLGHGCYLSGERKTPASVETDLYECMPVIG